MSETAGIQRQFLRSTTIIGGATLAGLAISLVRMKIIAGMIGAAGVGLFGMLNVFMAMGATIASTGLDNSGVKQLAAAADDPERLRVARWALWTYVWPLAVGGAVLIWLLRESLAILALGSVAYAGMVGWIALGVGATVMSAAQLAQVQALRRIGDLARIRVFAALAATVAGVAAIYFMGVSGIPAAILATPIATCVAALWFARKLPLLPLGRLPTQSLVPHWRAFASLGAIVMVTTTLGSIAQAAGRAVLVQELGLEAAGLFQASYAISTLNITLVLGALAAEYYPRLSSVSEHPNAVADLLNKQIHVGLVLAGPALLAISAAAPWILWLLYTSEFTTAALLLRIQLAADCLRVLGWSLGYVLLVRKQTTGFLLAEISFLLIFPPLTWLNAASFGVAAAGGAYLIGYSCTLIMLIIFAAHTNVRVTNANIVAALAFVGLLLGVAALSLLGETYALIGGLAAAAAAAAWSYRELSRMGVPILRTITAFAGKR